MGPPSPEVKKTQNKYLQNTKKLIMFILLFRKFKAIFFSRIFFGSDPPFPAWLIQKTNFILQIPPDTGHLPLLISQRRLIKLAGRKDWPLANPFISTLNINVWNESIFSKKSNWGRLRLCSVTHPPSEVFDQISSPIVDCFGHKNKCTRSKWELIKTHQNRQKQNQMQNQTNAELADEGE